MPAKGTPAYYRERREHPAPAPTARATTVRCPAPACGLSYLSYHPKCPFCGTSSESKDYAK
jgi:hypothetical protein